MGDCSRRLVFISVGVGPCQGRCFLQLVWSMKKRHLQLSILCLLIFLFFTITSRLSRCNNLGIYSGIWKSVRSQNDSKVVITEARPWQGSSFLFQKNIWCVGATCTAIVPVIIYNLSVGRGEWLPKAKVEENSVSSGHCFLSVVIGEVVICYN